MNRISIFGTVRLMYCFFICLACPHPGAAISSSLPDSIDTSSTVRETDLRVIPYPREVKLTGRDFQFGSGIHIVLDRSATEKDRFAAVQLADELSREWGIDAVVTTEPVQPAIRLTRSSVSGDIGEQGYRLTVSTDGVFIEAEAEPGLFYGTRTLLQLIPEKSFPVRVPGVEIRDWPDIPERAVHYDTKHSQDKREYVEKFIRELAHYKINMLVWEWEDKFEYPSHPYIGAPGAFTLEEMQELTRYAQNYHIQIVPLVQGLGHVSFILKWPQHKHLREIDASNWQFCAMNDGTYDLLFQLWEDAIEATPGSKYIHIGSDETYELGHGVECGCQARAEEIGRSGLFHHFLGRSARHLQGLGREVMAWERPLGWEHGDPIPDPDLRAKELVLTESYSWFSPPDFPEVRKSVEHGHQVFVYDPNPGIEPLFLPLFERKRQPAHVVPGTGEYRIDAGSLENSHRTLTQAAQAGVFRGMIRTSWDDAGLHNQLWMMQYIHAAEFSWSWNAPGLDRFIDSYPANYYGIGAENVIELFQILNEASYFFWDSLERKVWHYGTIGKTRLPDLPRGDALEYDPFWNDQYGYFVERSVKMIEKMNRALTIIETNLTKDLKNRYDFELYKATALLVKHTAQLYVDLSNVEAAIEEAHQNRFVSHQTAHEELTRAVNILEQTLARRREMFDYLVGVWEKTTLPKGYSTPEKRFFHQQDRARHFAFRRPDMSYLIYDEELLDIEGYLEDLKEYTAWFHRAFIDPGENHGSIEPFFNVPGY